MSGPAKTGREVLIGGAAAAAASALPSDAAVALNVPSPVSPPAASVLGRVIKQLRRGHVLLRLPDGHTVVQAPDGRFLGEPTEGRVFKQFPDGRVIRELDDGEVVRELPNGDDDRRSRGLPSFSWRLELAARWSMLEHRANDAAKSGARLTYEDSLAFDQRYSQSLYSDERARPAVEVRSVEQEQWDAMAPFRIEQELQKQALEHRAKAATKIGRSVQH